MRRLGLWARSNPVKVFLAFLALITLGLAAEQQVDSIGGSIAYFAFMFSAIVLVVAFIRGGRRR